MKKRFLGKLEVSSLGLGCMGMSHGYGSASKEESVATLHKAFDLGVTFFDTAEIYGPFENEKLVGEALHSIRDRVKIATKFGFVTNQNMKNGLASAVDSRPSHIREVAEASLKRLKTDYIDLFYQHRVDPNVPIEEVVGTMAELVAEGKVLHLGLSEVSVATLRRAHAVHPIAAVQSEYSLWTRFPENGILQATKELGVGLVPYSPLGRGWLTGKLDMNSLEENDFRRTQPRFTEEAIAANQYLLTELQTIADKKSVTPAQIALAWLLAQGDHIVPIPGARKLNHLQENVAAADITLSAEEVASLSEIFVPEAITGARYSEAGLKLIEI